MNPKSRLTKHLAHKKSLGQKTFIPFITPGFPNLKTTQKLLKSFVELGVDAIEIGMPFSDPMADGPVIQQASDVALKNGVHLNEVLQLVRNVRKTSDTPILLMGYYNPILQYGLERFANTAHQSGVDGLLIVDLPIEESKPLREALRGKPIDLIYLLTPTSTEERMQLVAKYGAGFVYYVSYTGITGSKKANFTEVRTQIQQIQRYTDLPLNIGFGISTPEDVRVFSKISDGVIVGSALIKQFMNASSTTKQLGACINLLSSMKKAVSS